MRFKFIAQFFVLAFLFSCTKNTELENALEMAGANRVELEKVLAHYSKTPADSLKLRAAEFLISNMVYHHTYENEKLVAYYKEIIEINIRNKNGFPVRTKFDSLGLLYAMPHNELKIKYDILNIKAHYLIDNIDLSMNDWYNNPWTQHLTFADFCEYVLPYRLGNENMEEWREKLTTKYTNTIDWIKIIDDIHKSTYWAARFLNDSVKIRGHYIYNYKKAVNIDHPCSVLEDIKLGTCDDYVSFTVMLMRAFGIPVSFDFTPQWPTRSMGHSWNVLFDESGKEIPFTGVEGAPGFPNRPGEVMAKVYRKTFSYQYESLFYLKHDEEIPSLFNTPYIKDVTANYVKAIDLDVELNYNTKNKFAYLALFNNANWIPIQWGRIKRNRAEFKAMGENCMYLPVIYTKGDISPVGKPFYIDTKNKIIEIKPCLNNKQTMLLTRKYPIKRTIYISSLNILGTTIIASNDVNFKDSVVEGVITHDPQFNWDTLQSKTNNPYRYWKVSGNKTNTCNIAELQFFYNNRNIVDTTNLLANIQVWEKNKTVYLFDNDNLTYVDFRKDHYDWITLDFGKPVAVDYFRFLPRNDANAITAGDKYELMMWGENGWKSLIKCVAKSDKLVLKNVPSGGLYLLHNHTKGKEERIFTYENGKQVWW